MSGPAHIQWTWSRIRFRNWCHNVPSATLPAWLTVRWLASSARKQGRMNWQLELALLSCALLGLRHGFDYDHLAAISDITAVQRNWKSGLRLGMTYALGHAFTVAALGIAVLEMHVGLPEGLDHWTERL